MCFALRDIWGEIEVISTRGECPSERARWVRITPSEVTQNTSARVHLAIPSGTTSSIPTSFFASGWIREKK